jgi:hypothetical protein
MAQQPPRPGAGRENVTSDDRARARRLVDIMGSESRARKALRCSETTWKCLVDGWRISPPRLAELRAQLAELGV